MPAPSLEILGPLEVTISESQQLSLASRATQPNTSCPAAAATFERLVRISFRWSLVEGPPVDFTAGQVALTRASPTLVVPPETLKAGSRRAALQPLSRCFATTKASAAGQRVLACTEQALPLTLSITSAPHFPPHRYVFQVTAELDELAGSTSSATVAVTVVNAATVVVGRLGGDVLAPANAPLVLTADPVDPSGLRTEWVYSWRCAGLCNGTMDEPCTPAPLPGGATCFNDTTGALLANDPAISIPAGTLLPGTVYEFECVISKEPATAGRVQAAFVTAFVPFGRAFGLSISGGSPAGAKLDPQQPLALEAFPRTGLAVGFSWSVLAGDAPSGLAALVQEVGGEQSTTGAKLLVAAGALQPGQRYVFRCDAFELDSVGNRAAGGAVGMATAAVVVNEPPGGGTLRLFARNGVDSSSPWADVLLSSDSVQLVPSTEGAEPDTVDGGFQALATQFRLVAQGWSDPEAPLSFTFFYLEPGQPAPVLLGGGAAASLDFRLPEGVAATKGSLPVLRLLVAVSDALGASASFVFPYFVFIRTLDPTGPAVAALAAEFTRWYPEARLRLVRASWQRFSTVHADSRGLAAFLL